MCAATVAPVLETTPNWGNTRSLCRTGKEDTGRNHSLHYFGLIVPPLLAILLKCSMRTRNSLNVRKVLTGVMGIGRLLLTVVVVAVIKRRSGNGEKYQSQMSTSSSIMVRSL